MSDTVPEKWSPPVAAREIINPDYVKWLEREAAKHKALRAGLEKRFTGTTHWDGCEAQHWHCRLLKEVDSR